MTAAPIARTAFVAGVRTMLPLLIGVVPFGIIVGITAAGTEIGGLLGFITSSVIFAGAAQLATIQLIDQGSAAAVVVATALVINSRHLMYSAAMAGPFQDFPTRWRFALPYVLTDQAFIVSSIEWETQTDPLRRRWFFLGVALGLWGPWQLATAMGVLVGAGVPASWQLEFAVPLVFLALLPTAIKAKPELAAAIVAGVVAVIAAPMPWNLGLIVATVCGIAVGVAAARARMTNVVIVVVIGIGTYLTRLSFIGALGNRPVPDALERPLRFIAPAVLAALVLPALVRPDGAVDLSPDNLRLLAGIVAGGIAWRTKNIGLTTAGGLVALWILDATI